jgi:hypothetical protein
MRQRIQKKPKLVSTTAIIGTGKQTPILIAERVINSDKIRAELVSRTMTVVDKSKVTTETGVCLAKSIPIKKEKNETIKALRTIKNEVFSN